MTRRSTLAMAITALLLLGIAPPAVAQQETLKNQLVGSWALVSTRTTRPDGTIYGPYGSHETGTLIFEQNGRFALILVNPDIPKYVSNNREMPTPDEALAAAKGSFAFFGSYSVNETDRTFVFHIEASSYPNFNGTDQKRIVKAINQDQLVFENLAPPNGGATLELI
jgi:Lipocalin-like domain